MTSESSSPKPVRAGRVLGDRYTLVSRIAKGGMGEVWRARDKRTGMMVAAKVLRPELTGEEISLSRLRLEAKNTMRARHPNIAMVLDSGEDEGQGWIVMELVSGRPLTDFVGDGNRLTAQQLLPILAQVAYALAGSAQAGIVHRDIKPANILVREDGMVKLTDFGISYAPGQANLTAVGMVMGTAQYLAPEQAMGGEATPSGDLYSLGVIAYEALAGQRPFTGKSAIDIAMSHVRDEPPALPNSVPDPLADIVFGLLAKDPAERPPSGTALVRALTRAAGEMGMSTAPMPLPVPDSKSHSSAKPTGSEARSAVAETDARPVAEAPAGMVAADAVSKGVARTATRKDSRKTSSRAGAPKITAPRIPSSAQSQAGRSDVIASQRSAPTAPTAPAVLPTGQRWRPLAVPAGEATDLKETAGPKSDAGAKRIESRPSSTSTPDWPPPRRRSQVLQSQGQSPKRTKATRPNLSRFGMWIIGALVALTIILIIIAMVRNGSAAALPAHIPSAAPTGAAATTYPEVALWLSPVLGC